VWDKKLNFRAKSKWDLQVWMHDYS
jgi:hypothetical protein